MENYKTDESLGFLTNRLATAMRRTFETKLKSYDLTAPQFGFLARLYEEDGQPLGNIGRYMYCDKPTITGIATRLEKKGLIKKIRDKRDRRVIKALLTRKGRDMKEPLFALASSINAGALKGLAYEEIRMLKHLLRKGLDNVLEQLEGGIINV